MLLYKPANVNDGLPNTVSLGAPFINESIYLRAGKGYRKKTQNRTYTLAH